MKTLYRVELKPDFVMKMLQLGFEVKQATESLHFNNIEDKTILYKAALKYPDSLSLEAAYQAGYLNKCIKDGETPVMLEVEGLPNLWEFMLPYSECPVSENYIEYDITPKFWKNQVKKVILIDKLNTKYDTKRKLPDTLLKDFGTIAQITTIPEHLCYLLKQFWFARDNVIYQFSQETLFKEINKQCPIDISKATKEERTLRFSTYSCKRGKLLEYFGAYIDPFLLHYIFTEAKDPVYTAAQNAPDVKNITMAYERGTPVAAFNELEFGEWLLSKIRPFDTGAGTLPADKKISPLALLSAFLWETKKEVPHPNITGLKPRDKLVSLINKIHQVKYDKWLKKNKLENNQDSIWKYFECQEHHSASPNVIKEGYKLYETIKNSSFEI